ncbi:MAG: DinB family protein [Ignavibacteriales bacterium]|nr:DinB family protein [Ignavibacteriales bacterium]
MSWTTLLKKELESSYAVTEKLLDLVEDKTLEWKPESGSNWMTTGQLLMHLTSSCGAGMKGFVTGDWGMPEGIKMEDLPPEEMLPPAEKMPTVSSVEEAKRLIHADKKLAFNILEECSEEKLSNEIATAPWDPTEMILGHRLLTMVDHLKIHKSQLFYYLKLQGLPVNTEHLWGV